nr:xylulose kinase-1 [Tanacetum cinerariifolium]
MVAYLSKSDASEGFNQIIDFLNGSYIKYALTMNPNLYVSCVKQFWTTVAVKQVNDVTRLQALVDKKKVVVTEATIRKALCLDDAEGVDCLSNEEIFVELARIGYEKPSTKLTFYKAFFSSQWKRVGKGFSRVETPLFEGMLVEQHGDEEGDADVNVEAVNAGDAAEGDDSAAHEEVPTVAEEQSIPSPTPPTPPPQPPQDIPSTSQVQQTPPQSPQDDAVVLKDDKEKDREVADVVKDVEKAKEDKTEPAEVQEVVDVVTTAKLITEVVTASSETVTAASVIITTAEAQVPATTLTAAPARVDEAVDHVKRKAKEDHAMDYFKGMSYYDIRLIFEAKFNSNVAFLLKTKEQIEEDEYRALQKINETPAERAAKRRKLDEEVEELKRHLQIVRNEDDDVYTEATLLAQKIPIVD